MKTYTVSELKRIAKEQGYKMAALENAQGDRVLSFNQVKHPIEKHLDVIPVRLKSEINPDGVYYVLMAHNIQKTKNPDRYPILKGKVNPDELAMAEKKSMPLTPVIIEKQESVLSWDSALKYQEAISDLKIEVASLKQQLNAALQTIEELEAEADEDQGLHEQAQPQNNILTFLKEALPSLTPVIDRHFDLEERKLNLKEMQLNKSNAPQRAKKSRIDVVILPGSQEHLNLIESLYDQGNEQQLNKELDKLAAANPEVYQQVLQRLGLEEEEEEGGENE